MASACVNQPLACNCDILHVVIVEVHCRATLRWQVLRKPALPPATCKGDLPGDAPALLLAEQQRKKPFSWAQQSIANPNKQNSQNGLNSTKAAYQTVL